MAAVQRTTFGNYSLLVKCLEVTDYAGIYAMTKAASWGITQDEIKIPLQCCPDRGVGAYSEDGTLVCACCCIPLDDHTAYLCILITAEPYRNVGVGRFVYRQTVERMGDRNIITDATVPALSFYDREGFTPTGQETYKIMGVPSYEGEDFNPELSELSLELLDSENLTEVTAYLKTLLDVNIARFSQMFWGSAPDLVFKCVACIDKKIRGTVSVRRLPYGINYFRVSCFYADNYDVAKYLLKRAIESRPPGSTFRLYCPSRNKDGLPRLLAEFGLDKEEYREPRHEGEVRCSTRPYTELVNFEKVYSMSNSFVDIV